MDESVAARHEEHQYLDIVRECIALSDRRDDRTGVGTFGVFGRQMRFSLSAPYPLHSSSSSASFVATLPLFTTKRTFFRGVLEELLWFIKGSTSARDLSKKGVKIWDANATRAFLDSRGLRDYEPGDLGPVYGFQWRHFGANYRGSDHDYAGEGVDQLAEVVRLLREDPFSRRIIMSAWNPLDLPKMALPPCHCMCQFWVSSDRKLSCMMYQRSCDLGLGVPFNVASYALLTIMIARVVGLEPGEFVHTLGDTHVYSTHVNVLKEQVVRKPFAFPTIRIARDVKEIDDFKHEDFELLDYKCHPPLPMEIAV